MPSIKLSTGNAPPPKTSTMRKLERPPGILISSPLSSSKLVASVMIVLNELTSFTLLVYLPPNSILFTPKNSTSQSKSKKIDLFVSEFLSRS